MGIRIRDFPSSIYWDETETWPVERIRRWQTNRLRYVLRYAYDHLPFYRRRFDEARFHPNEFRQIEDLDRVPTFKKQDVLDVMERRGFPAGMEPLEEDVSQGRSGVLCMTSGTSGKEAMAYVSRDRGTDDVPRRLWWAGWRPGMSVLFPAPAWHRLSFAINRGITRLGADAIIPWGTLVHHYSATLVDAMLRHRPEFVFIYPTSLLYAIVAEGSRRGLAPHELFSGVEIVQVAGEGMTPRGRAQLCRELNVKDIYEAAGSGEGLRSQECHLHDGHHLFFKQCYLEVIDPETLRPVPAGRRGHLVLTYLATPHCSVYLRYDTGDIGAFMEGECACGRTWPRFEIYGRAADLVSVGGIPVLHYDVRSALEEMPVLVGAPFAMLRDGDRSALRIVVQSHEISDDLRQEIAGKLSTVLGLPVAVKFARELPARWKGVRVIEGADLWDRLH